MSLQNGTNPIVLDAATQSVGKVKVTCIVWSGIGTGGDDLLINTVVSGSIVFEGKAAQYATVTIPVNGWLDGIYITTLDSGKVMVYLDNG